MVSASFSAIDFGEWRMLVATGEVFFSSRGQRNDKIAHSMPASDMTGRRG
jgi:hypothetical protein